MLDEGANTAGDDVDVDSNTVGLELAGSESGNANMDQFCPRINTVQGVYLNELR